MPDVAELLRAGGTAISCRAVIHPFTFCPIHPGAWKGNSANFVTSEKVGSGASSRLVDCS
jgi:hypothetical protein